MLNGKAIFLLLALLSSISAFSYNSAYAHKSQVIGDYNFEIGWDREPPIVGMENSITMMITTATDDQKSTSSDMDHASMADDEMTHDEHDDAGGITGLTPVLEMSVTLNDEKTELEMVEDEHTKGLYLGKYTPMGSGHPVVSFFAEINGEPIEGTFHPEKVEDGALIKTMSSDGTINVDVIATAPAQDKPLLVTVEFTDSDGSPVQHVNYDLVATQAGKEVLTESEEHAHNGLASYTTSILTSGDPVDIQVKLLGLGLPDEKENWTGPVDDTIPIHVTPEFGPIVMIVLGVAILSVVAIVQKSKIIPTL